MEIVKIDKNIRYLSEVLDDLPHNAFIDKGITDCGGTTLVLTNNEPYIVAVHSIALLKNKCEQHKDVLGVYSDISNDEISLQVEMGVKKIIVTYDSLPRLIKEIDVSKFRLLVDEVQVLIRYAGIFKSKVCNDLINMTYKFKSVSYMTATPPNRKYLPEPMKKLHYYRFVWKNIKKPNIKHKYVGAQINTKTVSYILDKWSNTNTDIFIFYNSRTGVVNTIKKLLQAEPEITLDNINIFFSKNDKNEEYFKSKLSDRVKIDVPLSSNKKRLNFISSFGFEGVDFYNKRVSVLVVSDPKYKSMRYDISIDIPQIIGRFRVAKECDIDFIWSSYTDEINLSEEEYIAKFKKEHDDIKKALSGDNAKNKEIMKAFYAYIKTNSSPHCYIDRDDSNRPLITINKYAFESMMSSYSAMNQDYYVYDDKFDDCNLIKRGSELFNINDSLTIPKLSLKHTSNLDRVCNFKSLCKEYVSLVESNVDNSVLNDINILLEYNQDLKKYHGVLSAKDFKKCLYVKKRLDILYEEKLILSKVKKRDFKFKVDSIYSCEYILNEIQRVYNKYMINKKPKTTDLKQWYKIVSTTQYSESRNKVISAYKIIS